LEGGRAPPSDRVRDLLLSIERMERGRFYDWTVVVVTLGALVYLYGDRGAGPPISTFLFWIAVLIAIELLPVTLAFESQVVMSFPIHLAIAMLYPPWAAMTIAGIGAFDPREFKREVALHRALFNRAQQMLSVGVASAAFTPFREDVIGGDVGWSVILGVLLATVLATVVNLVFVSLHVHFRTGVDASEAADALLPRPMAGFWLSYVVLGALGATTALVYSRLGALAPWAITAFLVPLLFARMTIIGAQTKQRLSERIQAQQRSLMDATEKIFSERERERARIAEWIHDSSLQTLAGANYACESAQNLLARGKVEEADQLLSSARSGLDEAIGGLRNSLVELRRPLVEQGGLLQAVREYLDQIETLWRVRVEFHADLSEEPPFGIAVGMFQILQESLVNALKHSGSARIIVKMQDVGDEVVLVVEDHGTGFDPGIETGADHMGLGLMRRRAGELGGRLDLRSSPGLGTRLEAVFPSRVST
jgi:signal transduction histidine kinase